MQKNDGVGFEVPVCRWPPISCGARVRAYASAQQGAFEHLSTFSWWPISNPSDFQSKDEVNMVPLALGAYEVFFSCVLIGSASCVGVGASTGFFWLCRSLLGTPLKPPSGWLWSRIFWPEVDRRIKRSAPGGAPWSAHLLQFLVYV